MNKSKFLLSEDFKLHYLFEAMEKRKFLLPNDFSDYDDSSCSEDNSKQNIVAVRLLPLIDLTADDHDSLLEVTSTPIDSIRKIKLEVVTTKRIKLEHIVALRQLPLIDLTADDHDSLLEVTSTPIDSIRKIKLEVDTTKRIKLELFSPINKRKFVTHFNDKNVIDLTIDLTQVIRVLI
jgi:hypothetical protein